jgi:AcrR family transcriptional regulator
MMSSPADNDTRSSALDGEAAARGSRPRRRNDSAASRAALLSAAAELFEERGYEGTTVRDIGELAGVDQAMIARYFGGKEGIYLAALALQPPPEASLSPSEVIAGLLDKSERRRHNPMTLAMVTPNLSETVREQVRPLVARKLTGPLADWLTDAGVEKAELLSELLVAVAVGISLTRASGTLPALSAVDPEDIQALLAPLFDAGTDR